jgi:hypothetical protein
MRIPHQTTIVGRIALFAAALTLLAPDKADAQSDAAQACWYSLYAVPSEKELQIVVNSATQRWGIPINAAIREKDVGSGAFPAESTLRSEDQLRMSFEKRGDKSADLVVHWDLTRVRIPVTLK